MAKLYIEESKEERESLIAQIRELRHAYETVQQENDELNCKLKLIQLILKGDMSNGR